MRLEKEARIEDIVVGSHKRPHILTSFITLGMVPIEWHIASSRLQYPINGQVLSHAVKGFEVGDARNQAVIHLMNIAKEHRPKWLFFFGDDMLPPWDGFVKLYEEAEKNGWDCLTGLYRMKQDGFPVFLTWRDNHIGRLHPGVHYQIGDVIDVDLTGLDFTLIKTSLLEQMEYPYFKTGPSKRADVPGAVRKYSTKDEGVVLHTEDVWFYNKAKMLGAKIGVHTGIRVSHLDVKTGWIY